MQDTVIISMLRHLIDDCGYSWETARGIMDRICGRHVTMEEIRAMYAD